MLHQLRAMTMGEPNAALLKELIDEEARLPVVLSRIAALHMASTESHESIRDEIVCAGDHFFPHPLDVPPLILYFFERLHNLWEESGSPQDDIYICAFAMWGVLAIHPFPNGNGRTSQDLIQFLLMKRWRCQHPPLQLPKDAYNSLAKAFATLIETCDGSSPEAFFAQRQAIASLMEKSTLDTLQTNNVFATVADYLIGTIHIEEE